MSILIIYTSIFDNKESRATLHTIAFTSSSILLLTWSPHNSYRLQHLPDRAFGACFSINWEKLLALLCLCGGANEGTQLPLKRTQICPFLVAFQACLRGKNAWRITPEQRKLTLKLLVNCCVFCISVVPYSTKKPATSSIDHYIWTDFSFFLSSPAMQSGWRKLQNGPYAQWWKGIQGFWSFYCWVNIFQKPLFMGVQVDGAH